MERNAYDGKQVDMLSAERIRELRAEDAALPALTAFQQWLRSSRAHDVLDDAVMGCLTTDLVDELCEDFGITRRQFRADLNAALGEGF